MRKLTPVHIAASVVIAITGTSAFAQKLVNSNIGGSPRSGMTQLVTPTTTSGRSAPLPTPSSATSSTTGTNGSATPNGSGTVVNNNGAGSDNTAASNAGTGSNANVVANPFLFSGANPHFFNGILARDFGPSDSVADNSGVSNNQGYASSSINAGVAANDTARTSASLDRVIKQAERDRKKAGRNGQLLYSIAPRSSVDRSAEMPDDGPTPALKGLTPGGSSRQ
jgi:hypothetical protein